MTCVNSPLCSLGAAPGLSKLSKWLPFAESLPYSSSLSGRLRQRCCLGCPGLPFTLRLCYSVVQKVSLDVYDSKNTSPIKIYDQMLLSCTTCCACILPTGCYIIKSDLAISLQDLVSLTPLVTSFLLATTGSCLLGEVSRGPRGLLGALVKSGVQTLGS